ncbi:MAG: hypothetical protein IT435_00450 [Phycisphaerales bacterium]|nr:hypothetical protein [Phycisphaerales bacterium]
MKRDGIIQLAATAVMVIALACAGVLAVSLNASIGRNRLVYTEIAEKGDPPEVALGIAMGAFRGIFVNYLWMRANDLKEDGKYWEAIELSKAITRLQPRFPRVWVFHAWNMAYNISVKTQTPEERWNWVQAGIRLIRDEAIPANPSDLILHKELAWLYLHKVQAYADDSNLYYKRKVAEEFTIVIGEPPRGDSLMLDRQAAMKAYTDWFRVIVDAPATIDEVLSADPTSTELLQKLAAIVGQEPYIAILRRYEIAKAVERSGRKEFFLKQMGTKSVAFQALVIDPKYARVWNLFVPHMRKRVLTDDYHYEPVRMLRVMQKYGPLDWRHPASHAVYWSSRGVELSLPRFTEANKDNFDFINVDRMTIQAIQELQRSGEIYFNFLEQSIIRNSTYMAIPNPHYTEIYGDIMDEIIARSWADTDKRAYSFYAAGYENFLKDQIRFFYRRGQRDEAERLYTRLRKLPQANMNDPSRAWDLSKPLDELVQNELVDRQTSPDVARGEIVGSLQRAFSTGLIGGNTEVFRQEREYAKRQHRFFFEEQFRINAINPELIRMAQIDPDFHVFEGQVFAALASNVGFDEAELMYLRAPDDLRVYAYDLLQDTYRKAVTDNAAQGERPFDVIFPEPNGLEAHRAAMERKRQAEQARQIQNETK